MPGAAEEQKVPGPRCKVLAYTTDATTRYLLDISVDKARYELQYANTGEDMMQAAQGRAADIFIMDGSGGQRGTQMVRDIAAAKWKHLVRIVLLTDQQPKPGSSQMQAFGPFCMLEAFFTRPRLNATLGQALTIKDTGSRVKADDKFFDVTIFNK